MNYEDEGERVLEVALLMVGPGAAESSGGMAKRPGDFMEFLRDMQRLLEFYRSSVNKVELRI